MSGWEESADPPRRRAGTVVLLVTLVAVVGWLARPPMPTGVDGEVAPPAPSDDEMPTPAPTTTGTPAPTSSFPQETVALLGLDEVLPVVEGRWRTVDPPDGPLGASRSVGPPVFVWDGRQVVAVDRTDAMAWDPFTDRWRDLPDLPVQESLLGWVHGLAVDGTVVLTDPQLAVPVGDDRRAAAWALSGQDWRPVTSVPVDSWVVGTADGGVLTAQAPGANQGVRLSLSDPAVADPVDLPELPVALLGPQVVELPGSGFVVLGAVARAGADSPRARDAHQHVALRWHDDRWQRLDLPPLVAFRSTGAWVPQPLGGGGPGYRAGRLLLAGVAPEGPRLRLVDVDLLDGSWTQATAPVSVRAQHALAEATLSAAWDGGDAVWLYGGYGSAVHLRIDLPTGTVAAARPTGGRVDADLVWADEGLLLLGGFGPAGPVRSIHRWTPD